MEALNKLRTVLCADSGPEESEQHRIYIKKPKESEGYPILARGSEEIFVDIFIAFDEAHTLVKAIDENNNSRFIVLCQALSLISSCPLYTFFLSTTGSIVQSTHPRPYIYLGFDQLMQSRKVPE